MRPRRKYFRAERGDFRVERVDFRCKWVDFRPKRADFRLERPDEGDKNMDARIDRLTKASRSVFYRISSP